MTEYYTTTGAPLPTTSEEDFLDRVPLNGDSALFEKRIINCNA